MISTIASGSPTCRQETVLGETMCFVQEAEWKAEVSETTEGPKTVDTTRCSECGMGIDIGEWHKHIEMQEYEECHDCEYGDCDCATKNTEDHECQCDPPNYGETFVYDRCEGCEKLLAAIREVEIESGCGEHESVPLLGDLDNQLRNLGDHEERKKYADRFKEKY